MEKVLSQDEINALFAAMSTDDPAPAPAATAAAPAQPEKSVSEKEKKIVRYDFHDADRVSQDQLRSLHMLYEAFGRNFASSLSAYLRAFVDVTLKSIEQVPYSVFVKQLPDPTLFASVTMKPLDSNMALEMNPTLVFPMIDMILGGPGTNIEENRNLTEIELNIIEGVIKLAMRDLGTAWRTIMDFDFVLDGKGTKPQMFQIVSQSEAVATIILEVKIGDFSGRMNMCIPSHALKQMRSKFDQQWQAPRHKTIENEGEKMVQLLQRVPVVLSGEIPNCKMTVGELLKVSVGDVITLSHRVTDPVNMRVGGIVKYKGNIVQHRGNISFEILDRVGH
ncbi:MAG: flagellar motor switch protein FliM [Acidobacteriota bacterium]|jgi:flagellar motor switch protein FliM|nr:flagellar motor switch protein FliM [Acidobacteriota bacterium]